MKYADFANYDRLTPFQKRTTEMLEKQMSIQDIMNEEGVKEQAVRVRILEIGKKLQAPMELISYADRVGRLFTKRQVAISASRRFRMTIPTSIIVFSTGVQFKSKEEATKNLLHDIKEECGMLDFADFVIEYVTYHEGFYLPAPRAAAICTAYELFSK